MGLIITEIQEFVQFSRSECFEELAQDIVNTRREGDKDSSKQILALTEKPLGNCIKIVHTAKTTLSIKLSTIFFSQMDQISKNLCEVKSLKRQIVQNLSCQVGLNVYFSAKLHMLKLYYWFLKKYVADTDFAFLESHSYFVYFSISKENLKDCVRPELKKEFYVERSKWMPNESCKKHFPQYLETK